MRETRPATPACIAATGALPRALRAGAMRGLTLPQDEAVWRDERPKAFHCQKRVRHETGDIRFGGVCVCDVGICRESESTCSNDDGFEERKVAMRVRRRGVLRGESNHSAVDVFNGQTLDRRNEEQRMASGSPRTWFPMKFPDGGTFEVTCSVARDGRVNYAQVVPGAPPSGNDIESLDASGYCGKGTAN